MHIAPSGKRYIGITRQPIDRRWRHGFGYKRNKHFYSAIMKYGWDNIEHVILSEGETEENALLMESEYISKYQTKDKRYGYNHTDGGEGTAGYIPSEETRKKMSLSRSGENNHLFGKHLTEETKRKISEAHIELCKSADFIAKMHDANTSKKLVYQYSISGEIIKVWESRHRAENYFIEGQKSLAIGKCCKGNCKEAYGFIWSFEPLTEFEVPNHFRKVYQYNRNGAFIKEWFNLNTAVAGYRPNKKSPVIRQCIAELRPNAYGFVWSYNPPIKAGEQVG